MELGMAAGRVTDLERLRSIRDAILEMEAESEEVFALQRQALLSLQQALSKLSSGKQAKPWGDLMEIDLLRRQCGLEFGSDNDPQLDSLYWSLAYL